MKLVNFDMCNTCTHKGLPETEDPCQECLGVPAREDSRRPVKYEAVENAELIARRFESGA